jgi:hypothetical protein
MSSLFKFIFILASTSTSNSADLIIYGSTPAGIASAVAFRTTTGSYNVNVSIILLDPGNRVGGMSSSGLGNSDIRTPKVLVGIL